MDLDEEPGKPDVSLCLSASDTFEEVMTMFDPEPYMVFTKKLSDKIYEGAFSDIYTDTRQVRKQMTPRNLIIPSLSEKSCSVLQSLCRYFSNNIPSLERYKIY